MILTQLEINFFIKRRQKRSFQKWASNLTLGCHRSLLGLFPAFQNFQIDYEWALFGNSVILVILEFSFGANPKDRNK